MKKLLILTSAFFLFSTSALAGTFPDVIESHEHFDAIEFLSEKHIVDGYDDGLFRPDQLVTRAEATKMIVGGLKVPFNGNYQVLFPDVKSDAWYFPYVMGGHGAGIIDGYPDGTFKPGINVNMAETLKILLEAAHVDLVKASSQVYADVSSDVWFSSHALFARDKNIVIADSEGKLKGEKSMTRAEFAEVVYRLMVVLESNGKPFPINTDWPLYKSPTMPFQMKYDAESWEVVEHSDETIFHALDKKNSQNFYQRTYPNSAKVTVSLKSNNGKSKTDYFAAVKAAFPNAKNNSFKLGGVDGLEIVQSDNFAVDWYFYRNDGKVMAVFTEYGDGELSYKWPRYIQAMLSSLAFVEPTGGASGIPVDETVLSKILENVLVKSVGLKMINTTGDATIIETDTIGVGTGPVDYYYSSKFDYTFKYERNSDLILDTRKGRTSAF